MSADGPTKSTTALIAVFAMLAFAAPLFVGLDRWDMRNDEAIYSYAVERILETGDWMTPRSIPTDFDFLEKPPLKFWIVAGAMFLGLTPNDEFGMRIFDALFGAAAFGYVFAFGWRLAGPFAGAIALMVLFTLNPLVFDHGLRSNNMEAALLLAYCGGLFHAWRWTHVDAVRRRRAHALACALYFALGFMTKFVAVVFLPMVAVAGLAAPSTARRLWQGWKDWLLPALVALVVIVPWFAYQTFALGAEFWSIIFGWHVYARFTESLDPSHVAPWHFYVTHYWREFQLAGSLVPVVAGVGWLVWRTVKGDTLARLVLLWWLLPIALISIGTSKLTHYAFPFMPPLALGAGGVSVAFVRAVAALFSFEGWPQAMAHTAARPWLRRILLIGGVFCGLLAAWTAFTGLPTHIELGGVRLFRNSSIAKPLIALAVIALATGYVRRVSHTLAIIVLFVFLPLGGYQESIRLLLTYDHPLRAAGECLVRQQARGRSTVTGLYLTDPDLVTHPPFYHLRHAGAWRIGPHRWEEEVPYRLALGQPVLIGETQWDAIADTMAPESVDPASLPFQVVRLEPNVLMALPGPYRVCAASIVAAGGEAYTAHTQHP